MTTFDVTCNDNNGLGIEDLPNPEEEKGSVFRQILSRGQRKYKEGEDNEIFSDPDS